MSPSGKFRTNPGWLCCAGCAAGVCESSLVVCAHEHGAMFVGAGKNEIFVTSNRAWAGDCKCGRCN